MNLNPSLGKAQPAEQRTRPLFSGPWLRWGQLTQSERFLCSFIILTPLWWFIGWTYIWFLITGAILSYQLWQGKGLGLKRPSLLVISGFLFNIYRNATAILNATDDVKPSTWISVIVGICFYFIIWYIESNNIEIRIEVIAWAISVFVLELLIFWVVFQLVLRAPHFVPPRTLISQFLDRSERYIKGNGSSNYLLPYWPEDKLPGGLSRFAFFYPVPEDFGLISGSISIFALEIKNRYWRAVLFCIGFFLLFVSGTRMAWIAGSTVLVLRYVVTLVKRRGIAIMFALIGLICFLTLSVPPITDIAVNNYTQTTESTSNLRRDSSEVRALIYKRTWEELTSEPDKLLLGRGVFGAGVVPGFEPAKVGSHSFILGTLLYREGLVGTFIFLVFWLSFITKLFSTQDTRPLFSVLIIVFISLTFPTMEFSLGHSLLLLFALLVSTKPKSKHLSNQRFRLYASA
jgi:O-Antigen ligase